MFNWLSGKTKSNLPEPTALQTHRTRQIEQLKAFNQNVSEIIRDLEYRVNVTISGTTLSLYITLPPQFPQEKPVVKVSPRVNHTWINDQMLIVGSPGVNNFVLHSDLGKVIREIIEEFHRNPPTMQPQQYGYGGYPYGASPSVNTSSSVPQPPPYSYQANQQPNIPTYQPTGSQLQPNIPTYPPTSSQQQPNLPTYPATGSQQQSNLPSYIANIPMSVPQVSIATTAPPTTTSNYTRAGEQSNFGLPNIDSVLAQSQISKPTLGTPGSYKMPDLPATLKPHIQHLSVLELQELLDDEDKMLEMVGAMPEIQKIATDREQYTETNEQMARNNLAMRPVLEEQKKVLLEKYDVFNDVKQQYDQHAQHQDKLRQKYDHRHILDKLKVATLEAEKQSEAIADGFLEGKLNVDEFRKNYMDKRKLSHMRHAKEERLKEMRF